MRKGVFHDAFSLAALGIGDADGMTRQKARIRLRIHLDTLIQLSHIAGKGIVHLFLVFHMEISFQMLSTAAKTNASLFA